MKRTKSIAIFTSLLVAMLGLSFVSQLIAQVEQPVSILVDVYERPLPDRHEPGLAPINFAPEPNAPTAPNAGIFGPYVQYSVDASPPWIGVGVGDFNNDGLNDVAFSNASIMRVLVQNDTGTLNSPVNYSSGNRSESLIVGDLNQDHLDDIVTVNFDDDTISVFHQQINGAMASRVTYNTNDGPDASAVADLNNDCRTDVVVPHWRHASIRAFYQQSDSSLQIISYPSLRAGYDDIDTGDVNGDGLMDAIKMNGQLYANPNFMVYLQTDEGTLGSYVSYDIPGDHLAHGIAVGDVTGDGLDDVVFSYGGNRPSSKIAVFAQTNAGTLIHSATYDAYDIPEPVEIADVNMDGRNDVIVVHGGWNRVGVFLQNPDGTLAPYELYTIPYASHYGVQGLDIGDINDDGAPDIVIGEYNQGLIVLYNILPSFYLTAQSDTLTVSPDSTVSTSVFITASNGFTENVTLSLTGLPPHIDYEISSNPISPPNEVTLTFTTTEETGGYHLQLQGTGGSITRTIPLDLYVGGDIPITCLSAFNSSPTEVGNTTYFTATTATGSNISYTWDYGDGHTGTGNPSTHDYASPGTYHAVVTATNAVSILTATTTVTIFDQPIADLSAANSSPTTVGNTTYLTATATSGTNTIYTWDYGDGHIGTGNPATHIYANPGTYDAIVTATNSVNTLLASTIVTISEISNTSLYLPIIMKYSPLPSFPIFISDQIDTRPVVEKGETFFETTIQIPGDLPNGGQYFLSAKPDYLTPVVVDDELFILRDGDIIFSHRFSSDTTPVTAMLVPIPIEIMNQIAGQTVVVEYRDFYGVVVSASEVWLVWIPTP